MDLLIHCALVWFNFHPNTQKPLSPALLHLVSNDADTADHTRSRFRPTFDTCEQHSSSDALLPVIRGNKPGIPRANRRNAANKGGLATSRALITMNTGL